VSSHGEIVKNVDGTPNNNEYTPPDNCQFIFYNPHMDGLGMNAGIQSQIGFLGTTHHMEDIYSVIENSTTGSYFYTNRTFSRANPTIRYSRNTWDYNLTKDTTRQWSSGVVCYDTTCHNCYGALTEIYLNEPNFCRKCNNNSYVSSPAFICEKFMCPKTILCKNCYKPRILFSLDNNNLSINTRQSINLSELVRDYIMAHHNRFYINTPHKRYIAQIHMLFCRVDRDRRPDLCLTTLNKFSRKNRNSYEQRPDGTYNCVYAEDPDDPAIDTNKKGIKSKKSKRIKSKKSKRIKSKKSKRIKSKKSKSKKEYF